jgi:phosphoglycolate phosphatase
MRTVIFDLDGTLADTSADMIAAANACFRARGHGDVLDPARDALTAFHGGRAMLREGFARLGVGGTVEIETEYSRFLEYYGSAIAVHSRLYPGARAAVEVLAAEGTALGICTNKPQALAEALLSELGLRDAFASLIGADTLPQRKPDPAPYLAAVAGAGGRLSRSMLIGDTATDRECARAAGVPVALVTFGPEKRGIARLEPEAMLDHFDNLPALVREVLGAP